MSLAVVSTEQIPLSAIRWVAYRKLAKLSQTRQEGNSPRTCRPAAGGRIQASRVVPAWLSSHDLPGPIEVGTSQ